MEQRSIHTTTIKHIESVLMDYSGLTLEELTTVGRKQNNDLMMAIVEYLRSLGSREVDIRKFIRREQHWFYTQREKKMDKHFYVALIEKKARFVPVQSLYFHLIACKIPAEKAKEIIGSFDPSK